ncbi:hypothetical protein EAE99_003650 [Botrytis elliptica]|nr:hypothetical protein EAE99_003650 [Botrytis elliptica]
MPGAETADYEFGRSMEADDHQQQSAPSYYLHNNLPMGLTAERYNQHQTGDTAPSYFRLNRSQQLTTPRGNHLPHFSNSFGFDNGNTGMHGGSNQYIGGYAFPTFASPSSLRANARLNAGSNQLAFGNQGGNSYYPNSGMAPNRSATFNPRLSTSPAQLIFTGHERSSFYPDYGMAPNQQAVFNPSLNAGSNQLAFSNQGGNSYHPNSRMAPNRPAIFNPSLDTGPTQRAFTDRRSPFYPNNGIARSQLAIFNPHPHMLSARNDQSRTSTPPAPPDPSTCFNVFSSIPSEHHVSRNEPVQTSPSDFVQIRVQDNGSSFSVSNETLASQSLSENIQYASPSEIDQDLENAFSFDHPNADTEPDMSNWADNFIQNVPYEGTYIGYKHTGEKYTGQTSTEHNRDGSATAYSNGCALEKKAFKSSQKISNTIEDEFDRQKLRRDAAETWAQTFVPPGMISYHEEQEKKYVSKVVYAYHPRGCENYYYRSVLANEVHVEHWANNHTRMTVWTDADKEFPSRIFDEYPADWSTNVDPFIEFSRNPQKQRELNDLRNQLCSSNNISAKHRYKPANPDTRPSWQDHQGGTITTTDHGTVDVPRSSITRDSIMLVVSRISDSVFTGATCGGSFSLWEPISRPPIERRQITHLSMKQRRNVLRRIRDLLERTWNLPSMQPELNVVHYMFLDCNSSPGFGQSPYLHVKLAIFDKFPKLPTELRWMIWEYCFPLKTEHLGLVIGAGNPRNEDQQIEPPITLRICYESRELTKRYYTIIDKPKFQKGSRYIYKGQVTYDKRKKEYSQPRQLILGPQDSVAISDVTPENRMEKTLEWYNQIDEKHRKRSKSIRHLEIRDIRDRHGDFLPASLRVNSNADRSLLIPEVFTNGSLAMFRNLQTLTLTNILPQTNWRDPRPFRTEEQEVMKKLISDYLDQTRVGGDRLVAKENIRIRDYTAMEGQKVKKDNGRIDFNEEFYSKMLTHLPEEYRNSS